jgi:hypothetical protein
MASKNEYKASELFQAQANLYNQIFSFMRPMSIKWAVELGIPDIIHNHGQPITLPELVAALRIPESKATCVHSIMRLLAHNKVFTIVNIDDNKEAYTLAPTSKLLVKGTNHCLSSMVHLITDPNIVDLYYQLSEWTSNEKLTIHETTFWDYYHQNPNHLKSFNDAMESDSHMVRLAINDCKFVFDGLTSLVDVGGGTGNTAKIISEAFPTLKCIVFDLPNVIEGLTDNNYLSFIGGNMFESIPQADAILLKVCMQEIRSKVKNIYFYKVFVFFTLQRI